MAAQLRLAGFVKALAHDRFALCFRAVESATRTEAFAGSLVLGGADARQHLEEMWFVPLTSTAYFAVEVESVALSFARVDGAGTCSKCSAAGTIKLGVSASVYNGGRGMIVDSGTTDMYLPRGCEGRGHCCWSRTICTTSTDICCIPLPAGRCV